MHKSRQVRIEASAAKELARWKSLFADEVCEQARQFAARTSEPNLVTLSHYRLAAESAVQSLSAAIQNKDADDARKEAA